MSWSRHRSLTKRNKNSWNYFCQNGLVHVLRSLNAVYLFTFIMGPIYMYVALDNKIYFPWILPLFEVLSTLLIIIKAYCIIFFCLLKQHSTLFVNPVLHSQFLGNLVLSSYQFQQRNCQKYKKYICLITLRHLTTCKPLQWSFYYILANSTHNCPEWSKGIQSGITA